MSEDTIMNSSDQHNEPTFRALIADDYEGNRTLFQLILESIGYEIHLAQNGHECLNILQTQYFDLLILDLQMPRVDGETVLESIRRHPIHRKMCVVVVTANPYMTSGTVEELADFVMIKPVDPIEFRDFLARLKNNSGATHSTAV